MRINFDKIGLGSPQKTKSINQSPIKIQIQSPIYNQVTRQLNPNNFLDEINSINSVISLPSQITHFIAEQIEKQMEQMNHSEVEQVSSVSYFADRTKSEINIGQNKINQLQSKQITTNMEMKQKKNRQKQKKLPNNTAYNYKRHVCSKHEHIPTETRHIMQQMHQLTYVPRIKPNAVNDKIDFNRKFYAYTTNTSKKSNIYNNLYQQAKYRKMKAQVQKQIKEQNFIEKCRLKINNNYFQKSNKTYTNLNARLNNILYSRVDKLKQQQALNLTTGRKLFQPDLKLSKQSYKIYLKSLSKEKKQSLKSIQKNQSMKSSLSQKYIKIDEQSLIKKNPIDEKTIEHFTQIFYPDDKSSNNFSTLGGQSKIQKSQFFILQSFLHQIEQFQSKKYEQETTVSSSRMGGSIVMNKFQAVLSKQQFSQKLKDYYQKLSLYDKQILRAQVWKKGKQKFEKYESTLEKTFHPTISIRSFSLDKLKQGHIHEIYYV